MKNSEHQILNEMEIESWSKNFSLNRKELESRVKSTIVLLWAAVSIFCAVSLSSKLVQYVGQLSLPVLVVPCFFFFLMLTKLALSRIKLEILLEGGKLTFPYYYVWLTDVPLKQIYSLEELKGNGETETLIVVLNSGSLVYFDRNIFASKLEFEKFRKQLLTLVSLNGEHNSSVNSIVATSSASNTTVQVLVILSWVAVFFLISSNSPQEFNAILEEGAISREGVLRGEVYRVSSSFFLHSSFSHLVANVLLFTVLNQFLLRLIDVYRYINILFISSLIASFVTLLAHQEDFVIGASGGVFGLFGAFCAIKNTQNVSDSPGHISGIFVVSLIFIEMFFGAVSGRVDVYSHLGGFLSGFFLSKLFFTIKASKSIYLSSSPERFSSLILLAIYYGGFYQFLSNVYINSW